MKRDTMKPQFVIVALSLGVALACSIGSPAPTSAPPEAATDTPAPVVAADTPMPEPTDTPQPTDTPTPPTTLEVEEANFAHSLDDKMRAVDPGSDFTPEETVYLSLTVKGRPQAGEVAARFYWHDDLIAEAAVDLADVNSGVIFSLGEST